MKPPDSAGVTCLRLATFTMNTRRLTLATLAFLLIAAPGLFAEDKAAPAPKPDKPGHERGVRGEDRPLKELGLNADQQAKWRQLGEQQRAAAQAIRDDASLSPDQRKAKLQELMKSFADQRRALLTPDQQKKFDAMQVRMRERLKERREHAGFHDGPPSSGEK